VAHLYSSNNVMYCDICRKAGPDIAICYRKEKFKRESLVHHNKNLKHNFFLNMVSAKHLLSHSGHY
jgi:hypothetical protein